MKRKMVVFVAAFLAFLLAGMVVRHPVSVMVARSSGLAVDDRVAILETRVAEHDALLRTLVGVTATPEPLVGVGALPASLEADEFYRKYLDVDGLPLLAPNGVSDDEMLRAREVMLAMVQNRPGQLGEMSELGFRVALFDYSRGRKIDQLPEAKAAGIPKRTGAFFSTPYGAMVAASSSEHYCSHVLIHEFAHAVYHAILRQPGGDLFRNDVSQAYRSAMDRGLWSGHYAATKESEYWADTVSYWFLPDVFEQLFGTTFGQYDPLADRLIGQVFGDASLPEFCQNEFVDIRGTVLDHNGDPLEGIHVVVVLWSGWRNIGLPRMEQKTAITDADGNFVIKHAMDEGVQGSKETFFTVGLYRQHDDSRIPLCSVVGWLNRGTVTKDLFSSRLISVRMNPIAGLDISVPRNFDWSAISLCPAR